MNFFRTREEMIRSFAYAMDGKAVGVEVGTQAGNFAKFMLNQEIQKLHLVDAWMPLGGNYAADPANATAEIHALNESHVRQRFEACQERITIHKGLSQDIARNFNEVVDFIYLDAAHDYDSVLMDLFAWCKWVKPSGTIMGHDFTCTPAARKMGFGVVEAVRDFTAMTPWKLIAITSEEWPSFALKIK